MTGSRLGLVALAATALGCASDPAPGGVPSTLDAWALFDDTAAQAPAPDVHPYEVISPLFSDETIKRRFVRVPAGTTIAYHATERWGFPVGTVLVKTFAYPIDARDPALGEHLLETRLLVHEADGWHPHTYVWDEAQRAARRAVAGDVIPVDWIDATGTSRHNDYVVPTVEECHQCHGTEPDTIGGRTRQWNRPGAASATNQIDAFAALGLFDVAPEPAAARQSLVDPYDAGQDLVLRARAYLDANCSHCHSTTGIASSKALYLDFEHTNPLTGDPVDWGVCKAPTSAGMGTCGLYFDVVPMSSATSILVCRIESEDNAIQMPPLGRNLVDQPGVDLLRAWIDQMTPTVCGP